MISVIIPAHNRPDMLKNAVCSVLNQTCQDFELIVVDDGSTADLSTVKDLVIESGHQYLNIPKQGVAAARNKGLAVAKGDWICLLDSDDLWFTTKLEKQILFHNSHPEILVSQTEEVWYRNGNKVNKKKAHEQPVGDAFEQSLKICCISSSSVMFKREVFDACGPYDERLTVCEDYDFWLRVTRRYKLGLVPELLVEKFGGHADQLSKAVSAMDRYRLFALLKLLINQELTSQQQVPVLAAIQHRAKILYLGAKKRNLPQEVIYHKILNTVSEASYPLEQPLKTEFDNLLLKLEELL